MPHHKAVTASREAPVRDQGDLIAQAAPHDRTGRAEHFAHPGTTLGSLVLDDDDVACPDASAEDRLRRTLLTIEYARAARELQAFLAGDLRDGAVGGHV